MNFTNLDEVWGDFSSGQRRFSVSSRPESVMENHSRSFSPTNSIDSVESFFADSASASPSPSPSPSLSSSSSRGTIVVGGGTLGNEQIVVSPPGASLESVFKDQEVQLVPVSNSNSNLSSNSRNQDIAGNQVSISAFKSGNQNDRVIRKILQIENKLDEAIGSGSGSRQTSPLNTMLEAGLMIGVGLFILIVMEMMLRMGRQHITYKFKIVD